MNNHQNVSPAPNLKSESLDKKSIFAFWYLLILVPLLSIIFLTCYFGFLIRFIPAPSMGDAGIAGLLIFPMFFIGSIFAYLLCLTFPFLICKLKFNYSKTIVFFIIVSLESIVSNLIFRYNSQIFPITNDYAINSVARLAFFELMIIIVFIFLIIKTIKDVNRKNIYLTLTTIFIITNVIGFISPLGRQVVTVTNQLNNRLQTLNQAQNSLSLEKVLPSDCNITYYAKNIPNSFIDYVFVCKNFITYNNENNRQISLDLHARFGTRRKDSNLTGFSVFGEYDSGTEKNINLNNGPNLHIGYLDPNVQIDWHDEQMKYYFEGASHALNGGYDKYSDAELASITKDTNKISPQIDIATENFGINLIKKINHIDYDSTKLQPITINYSEIK